MISHADLGYLSEAIKGDICKAFPLGGVRGQILKIVTKHLNKMTFETERYVYLVRLANDDCTGEPIVTESFDKAVMLYMEDTFGVELTPTPKYDVSEDKSSKGNKLWEVRATDDEDQYAQIIQVKPER